MRLGRGKGRNTMGGSVLELVDPGPHGSPARCPHAAICGGCAMPRTTYDEQLRQKRAIVERALVAAFEDDHAGAAAAVARVQDVVPAERLEGYRNKMDFTFGSRRFVPEYEPEGVDASSPWGYTPPPSSPRCSTSTTAPSLSTARAPWWRMRADSPGPTASRPGISRLTLGCCAHLVLRPR